ncbi:carbamoyltransferase N-terminal domain-containing protein [Spongiimicrobium salis]|uniref:carbamoyltransferase N-terminal domain-containing protein n=1 Tax=Spongiimicrobium salis TaxID=1667022 RepID=UPI00374CC18F
MKILALKLTHDGSISVVNGDSLEFCIELEKLDNNNRFKILNDTRDIEQILNDHQYSLSDFDHITVDGWIGQDSGQIDIYDHPEEYKLRVAPYGGSDVNKLRKIVNFDNFIFKGVNYPYSSTTHLYNHLIGSYATSSFSKKRDPAYLMVWDGGTFPLIYFFNPKKDILEYLGSPFYFGANVYSIFCQHFGPYKKNGNVIKDELSIAGKIMAYVALGEINNEILNSLNQVYDEMESSLRKIENLPNIPYQYATKFIRNIRDKKYRDEDIITTFHYFIETLLINGIRKILKRDGNRSENLCYSGGAALNIKWNSKIRKTFGLNIWIPPFPNDSGSSIGAAAALIYDKYEIASIDWDVYRGPYLKRKKDINHSVNWKSINCSPTQLAHILFKLKKPVVFLTNNAELGPRALGNRSILADATTSQMKVIINDLKQREQYRPLAPICIESMANKIFTPGGTDPYMLFEHRVNRDWSPKIPAVIHSDGTARLQTINSSNNKPMYNVLMEYYKLSGIPVLVNTSANYKGRGFFPDVESAMDWGKIDFIWSENVLFYNEKQIKSIEKVFELKMSNDEF